MVVVVVVVVVVVAVVAVVAVVVVVVAVGMGKDIAAETTNGTMDECGSDGIERFATLFSTSRRRLAAISSFVISVEMLKVVLSDVEIGTSGTGIFRFVAVPKFSFVVFGSPLGGLRFKKGVLLEEMEEEEEFEEDVVLTGIFVIGKMVRNPQAATAVPGVAPFEDVGGTGEGPSAAMFWVVLMEDVISFVDLVDFAEFGFRLK